MGTVSAPSIPDEAVQAAAKATRPAAPVEGLERYDLGYIGPDGFILPYKDGEYVRFDQAEAIIAAEREGKRFWQNEYTQKSKLLLQAEADNAALTARVKKLETRLEFDPGGGDKIDELESAMAIVRSHAEALETQLAAAAELLRQSRKSLKRAPYNLFTDIDAFLAKIEGRAALEAYP